MYELLRIFSLVLILLPPSGCRLMEETYFDIAGEIRPESAANKLCRLEIHEGKRPTELARGTELDWREVGRLIKVGFVLSAADGNYYFALKCHRYQIYMSKTYVLGDSREFASTIDLGVIDLKISPAEPEASSEPE